MRFRVVEYLAHHAVPAGGALAVDREGFARTITERVSAHPNITVHRDEITELEDHGVDYEDYDLPELTTVDHVAEMGSERAAWFKDPDGNVLCLHQEG